MDFGINLYSLRTSIATEDGFLTTAKRLKDMGYSYLQFSGAPLNAEMIKRVSGKSGMPVYLTHSPMGRILDDADALMDEHALFGCKNIGLGALPFSDDRSEENAVKELIARLNEAGAKMKKRGCKLFYHNHNFEFMKTSDGETWFDYIARTAENIFFTLDVYWVRYGGASILRTLEKANGRAECIHLKDFKTVKSGDWFAPRFAAVGDGTIEFADVIAKAKECGAKYFFVEQDDACDYPDPFAEVGKSINYLLKNF